MVASYQQLTSTWIAVGCFSVDNSACIDDSSNYYCQQHHQSRHDLTSLSAGHVLADVTLDAPCHVYVYGAGAERAPAGIYSVSGAKPDVFYTASQHCVVAAYRK